jgi:hypothetical protein
MLLRSMWPRIGNQYPTNYRDVVRYFVGDSRNNVACQGNTTPKSRRPAFASPLLPVSHAVAVALAARTMGAPCSTLRFNAANVSHQLLSHATRKYPSTSCSWFDSVPQMRLRFQDRRLQAERWILFPIGSHGSMISTRRDG